MSIVIPILITLLVIVSILMVLVVLMQRPRSEGLGAAFGGGMTENIFGAQTTHVLARFTAYLGAAFFALTLLLAMAYAKSSGGTTKIQRELLSIPAPAAPETTGQTPAVQPVAPETAIETPAAPTTPVETPATVAPEATSPPAPGESSAAPAPADSSAPADPASAPADPSSAPPAAP